MLNKLKIVVTRPAATIVMLLVSATAFGQCPDDGRTYFCEVDKGFKGVTFFGNDSYQAFFVGSRFRVEEDPNRVAFWVDELLLEWRLIGFESFHGDPKFTIKQQLGSYFKFEIDYISKLKQKNQILVTDIKLFKPLYIKEAKIQRTFQIMKAILGKKGEQAPQYWVATTHPRGIVLLSVIQPKKADSKAITRFIDSYMNSFNGVDAAFCDLIRQQQSQTQKTTESGSR